MFQFTIFQQNQTTHYCAIEPKCLILTIIKTLNFKCNSMTKKDFFRIIIKLFGLYWLINSLFSIGTIGYFSTLPNTDFTSFLFPILVLAFFIALFVVLIHKADTIIRLLRLDQGFDEDRIDFQQFGVDNLLMLGTIIIGGFMILDNIPAFINQSYLGFKVLFSPQKDIIQFQEQSTYQWFVSGTKIIFGYLLLTNYPTVSKYLLKLTQKNA